MRSILLQTQDPFLHLIIVFNSELTYMSTTLFLQMHNLLIIIKFVFTNVYTSEETLATLLILFTWKDLYGHPFFGTPLWPVNNNDENTSNKIINVKKGEKNQECSHLWVWIAFQPDLFSSVKYGLVPNRQMCFLTYLDLCFNLRRLWLFYGICLLLSLPSL